MVRGCVLRFLRMVGVCVLVVCVVVLLVRAGGCVCGVGCGFVVCFGFAWVRVLVCGLFWCCVVLGGWGVVGLALVVFGCVLGCVFWCLRGGGCVLGLLARCSFGRRCMFRESHQ